MNLLNIKDAAAYLAVSPRTVRKLIDTRRIGYYKVGGCIRLAVKDLDGYLKTRYKPKQF